MKMLIHPSGILVYSFARKFHDQGLSFRELSYYAGLKLMVRIEIEPF